jgi:hypothetical protein
LRKRPLRCSQPTSEAGKPSSGISSAVDGAAALKRREWVLSSAVTTRATSGDSSSAITRSRPCCQASTTAGASMSRRHTAGLARRASGSAPWISINRFQVQRS